MSTIELKWPLNSPFLFSLLISTTETNCGCLRFNCYFVGDMMVVFLRVPKLFRVPWLFKASGRFFLGYKADDLLTYGLFPKIPINVY